MMFVWLFAFSVGVALVTAAIVRLVDPGADDARGMRSGGTLIWLSIVLSWLATSMIMSNPGMAFGLDAGVVSLLLIVGVGILDDSLNLSWRQKLAGEVAAMLPLAFAMKSVVAVSSAATFVVMTVVCIFWLLLLVNGANLMDGIDGYVGAWSLLTILWMLFVTFKAGLDFPLARVLALATGPLLLFVVYNRWPARVFLGDAGSLSLGFAIGLMAILLLVQRMDGSRLAAVLIALTLPILEVATTIIRRVAAGRSVVSPDKQHIHHRLVQLYGGKTRRAADTLMVAQIGLLALASAADTAHPVIAGLVCVVTWSCAISLWLFVVSLGGLVQDRMRGSALPTTAERGRL